MKRRRLLNAEMMEHIIEYTTTEENQEIKLFQNFKPIAYCEDLDNE